MAHANRNEALNRVTVTLAAGLTAAVCSQGLAQSMSMATTTSKLANPQLAPAVRYVIYDLGSLAAVDNPGDDISANGLGMNEHGDVCGRAETAPYPFGSTRGFVWDYATSTMTEVSGVGVTYGISDNDKIVGIWSKAPYDGSPGFVARPYLAGPGLPMHDPLYPVGFGGGSWAVNNSGQTACAVDGRLYFVDSDGTIVDFSMPNPENIVAQVPWEINNNGVVVGMGVGQIQGGTFDGTYTQNAISYNSATDTLTNLHDNQWWSSGAYGLNDRGDVAGFALWDINGGDYIPATVWTAEGDVIEFGIQHFGPGYAWDQAEHINMQGDVVGTCDSFIPGEPGVGWVSFEVRQPQFVGSFTDSRRPFQHRLRSLMSQRQRLDWTQLRCFEINDARQIAGMGVHNGRTRAFLADPIPVMTGDFNLDTVISLDDVMVMANNFGKTGARPMDGDLNFDRTVDMTDVMMFMDRALQAATLGN